MHLHDGLASVFIDWLCEQPASKLCRIASRELRIDSPHSGLVASR